MNRIQESCEIVNPVFNTAKEEGGKANENLPFAVESSFEDGLFTVAIQGRMDTITAPKLLQRFKLIPGKATAITVDVERMSYISSAGLRVLLMMYKSLDNKSRFKMVNMNEDVREILTVTGFNQFF